MYQHPHVLSLLLASLCTFIAERIGDGNFGLKYIRSVEDRSIDGPWTDYRYSSSLIIIEKRKKGVLCTRHGSIIKYKRREISDVEEIKEFLER